jgi:hypothetical protein
VAQKCPKITKKFIKNSPKHSPPKIHPKICRLFSPKVGAQNFAQKVTQNVAKKTYLQNWNSLGPLILFHRSLEETMSEDVELANKIKKFYFGEGGKISQDNLENYKHLVIFLIDRKNLFLKY